jgi:hypothetical protein
MITRTIELTDGGIMKQTFSKKLEWADAFFQDLKTPNPAPGLVRIEESRTLSANGQQLSVKFVDMEPAF